MIGARADINPLFVLSAALGGAPDAPPDPEAVASFLDRHHARVAREREGASPAADPGGPGTPPVAP